MGLIQGGLICKNDFLGERFFEGAYRRWGFIWGYTVGQQCKLKRGNLHSNVLQDILEFFQVICKPFLQPFRKTSLFPKLSRSWKFALSISITFPNPHNPVKMKKIACCPNNPAITWMIVLLGPKWTLPPLIFSKNFPTPLLLSGPPLTQFF